MEQSLHTFCKNKVFGSNGPAVNKPGSQAGIGLINELRRVFGARIIPDSSPDLTIGPINGRPFYEGLNCKNYAALGETPALPETSGSVCPRRHVCVSQDTAVRSR
jgi:hypothetical protein